MKPILFYECPGYMFSNFSAFALEWRGRLWMTAEHAYQAMKFEDESIQAKILEARSAHDAKKVARAHAEHVRKYWDDMKLEVMENILRVKLSQHPFVKEKLIASSDALLIEDSPKDSFWGRGPDWKGENHLGKLWMKLRAELRQ